jgi:hypothetical protein
MPEPFSIANCEPIAKRREVAWRAASKSTRGSRKLTLMIAELKELHPLHCGAQALVKQLPGVWLALHRLTLKHIQLMYERELSLWGADDQARLIICCTFDSSCTRTPRIGEMAIMAINSGWVPVMDQEDMRRVADLVGDGRSFRTHLSLARAGNGIGPSPLLQGRRGPMPVAPRRGP